MVERLNSVEDHFKLHKFLLNFVGLWPGEKTVLKRFVLSIIVALVIGRTIAQILGTLELRHDFNAVIGAVPSLGNVVIFFVGMTNSVRNYDKMQNLLHTMKEDWNNAETEAEIKIIKQHARGGLKIWSVYAVNFWIAVHTLNLGPLFDDLRNPRAVDPLTNVTLPRRLPTRLQYYVNHDDHFYEIVAHCYISALTYVSVLLGIDALYIIHVQHGTTKFRLLKYKLSQLIEAGKLTCNINPRETDDIVYQRIKVCVKLHEEAIEFANSIESTYATYQLFNVGLCCLLLSITGLHAAAKMRTPHEVLPYIGQVFNLMLHILLYSYPSEQLMDQSNGVSQAVYDMEWYRISIRSRKLLLQIMTRSSKSCKITAGGVYVMSMENYSKILSTAMSYFTVLSSIQEENVVTD